MNTNLLRALRWLSLLAVLLEVGRLEVQAGLAAGWQWYWALGISLAVDAGVLLTLLTPRLRWWDRVGAILLLEAAVVLSVLHPDPKLLGVGIATALVLTLWRVEALFRSTIRYGDELAAARREREMANRAWRVRWRAVAAVAKRDRAQLADMANRIARYEATIAELRGELRAAEARVMANAGEPAATGSPPSPPVDPHADVPTGTAEAIAWLAQSLQDGQAWTWRQVQAVWPDLSERSAQRRLTDATKAAKRHGLTAVTPLAAGGEA